MGFKPETMTNMRLPALGWNGPSDQKSINAFLAASPAAAAKMGKYTMAARQMVEGKPVNANRGLNAIQSFHKMRDQNRQANIDRGVAPGAGFTDPRQQQHSIYGLRGCQ